MLSGVASTKAIFLPSTDESTAAISRPVKASSEVSSKVLPSCPFEVRSFAPTAPISSGAIKGIFPLPVASEKRDCSLIEGQAQGNGVSFMKRAGRIIDHGIFSPSVALHLRRASPKLAAQRTRRHSSTV